jgi:hypothetical protein
MDRSALTVAALHDESDEKAFWQTKNPAERLEALELMRQILYGYDDATAPRLQRVLDVVERARASDRPKDLNDSEHLP